MAKGHVLNVFYKKKQVSKRKMKERKFLHLYSVDVEIQCKDVETKI